MSVLELKSNSQIQNEFIFLNQIILSRIILTLDSRRNSPIDCKSRNKFDFSNRTSRILSALESRFILSDRTLKSISILNLRANSLFDYTSSNRTIPLRLIRSTFLKSKDNALNILNNTFISTQNMMNSDTILLPFNEMTI